MRVFGIVLFESFQRLRMVSNGDGLYEICRVEFVEFESVVNVALKGQSGVRFSIKVAVRLEGAEIHGDWANV